MDFLVQLSRTIPVLSIAFMLTIFQAHGLVDNTTCMATSPSTFIPCINSIININGEAFCPPAECCRLLENLISNGVDCFCLTLARNDPFLIPTNRTLAIFLPHACNMTTIPLQCNASGSPLPASGIIKASRLGLVSAPSRTINRITGPASFGPAPSPRSQAPSLIPLSPISTAGGRKVVVSPSAAVPFYSNSHLLLFPLAFLVIN